MKSRVLMLLACALIVPAAFAAVPKKKSAPATKSSAPILPFAATEKTLPNGLKVIIVPTGFPNVVSVYTTMQTGSRNEIEPGKSGFAHFFEHVMFRGTEKYPPEKYNAIVQKAGARQNANTSDDRTIFHQTFAKEDLPQILEIEADRFKNLSYPENVFKTEARAVLGEYNKNAASPLRKILEVQRDAAFNTHTYKHTTMGFIKDIEDMPNQYAYSKEFFRRWYRPEYATLIIAGDVKASEVMPLVEKYYGDWKHGDYKAAIPQEPPQKAPIYAHVQWDSPTIPWITVGYRVPGFDENSITIPAIDTALDLEFGDTSDLHKKLVEDEQKVDRLFYFNDAHVDPSLYTIFARVKDPKDAVYVRDEILKTFAKLRDRREPEKRVNDAKSNARYAFVRSLDNTEAITETVAEYAKFRRSFNTVNNYYRELAKVTPKDIQDVAKQYFTDKDVVITTLSHDPLPAGIDKVPAFAALGVSMISAATGPEFRTITQKSVLPQLDIKLLFTAGSVNDPAGKEGLAALAASMISDGGSKQMRLDEINKALYPMAGAFNSNVDKEMTTFTATVHKDNWSKFFDIVLPQLLSPGFRNEDFQRLKDQQLNTLKQDLRNANEEELGKEELINRIYAGTPYGHTVLGTVAGINAITLDDVRNFIAQHYTRGNLVIGISGDYPAALQTRLEKELATLPAGGAVADGKKSLAPIAGQTTDGLNVEIIQKDTRSTAISMGMPIPVTRENPDFAALNVARVWLGEHRASTGRLYQRLREIRGLNYGDYAYLEFFTHPGASFFPSPNIARRSQIFEIWIRPVVPANAQMSMRLALYELNKLIDNGLSQEDFEATRGYLMKNVYLMTASQDQRLGYALDSWWYGIPEYTSYMRAQYTKLTRDDVNAALKKYLSAKNLNVVIVTKDAEGLRDQLVKDDFSAIKYDAPKPDDIVAEDKIIGAYKLNIKPENVKIVPVDDIFAK
ncbi:MAG TPA: pitrilysin family protein [Thermoanaerobaculia bacterium]|nr:pitrilysin family protein [Thermoanaerobaculia bacterium]